MSAERRAACSCPGKEDRETWLWLEGDIPGESGGHGEGCSLWRPVMTEGAGL